MKYIYNKNRITKSTQTSSEGIIIIFIFYYQFYDCVFIMSHTRFSVNLHSVVAWMSSISLLETGAISKIDCNGTRTRNHSNPQFINVHSII